MTRKNRIGRNTHRLADIGLPDKPKLCRCEYCQTSAAAYDLHGPVGGPIFAFRDIQLSHLQQVRIKEIYGLNILRIRSNSYIVCAEWMMHDDSLIEFIQSIVGAEPVVLGCES